MSFTNPNAKTNVLGLTVPNVVLYGVIALVVLFVFGLWKGIRNIFRKVTGVFSDDQAQDILEDTIKSISNLKDVQYQMTATNQRKAAELLEAMQGPGTDEKKIAEVFMSITGANQFGAVYTFFGIKQLDVTPIYLRWIPSAMIAQMGGSYKGDLIGCLKSELSTAELNKRPAQGKYSIAEKCAYLDELKRKL